MRIVCTFVLTLAVLINSSECSSHPAGNHYGERNPGPSSSTAGQQRTSDRPPLEEPPVRPRSRSPAHRRPPIEVLGYSLKELGNIRLIPQTNDGIRFEFRRYNFPVGAPIRIRGEKNRRVPVPIEEQIVLSLSNGDIFAILDDNGFLVAIYRADKNHPRVKMNMVSGGIVDMTLDEMRDCPAGKNLPIYPRNFRETFSHENSLESVWNHRSKHQQSSSVRSRPRSYPSRPHSYQVRGCESEQLGYVRLIPRTNPNQKFEFRKYVFPANEKIRMRIEQVVYSLELNQEYMVFSTSDGEIFAIIDNSDTLRGIYNTDGRHSRIKVDMMSGQVTIMTSNEKIDVPVGKTHPILSGDFIKAFADQDSLQFTWHSNAEGIPSSSSSSTRQPSPPGSPPGRPPSHEVLGYTLAQLGYIRVIPLINPNQRFEFRRYVFPAIETIRLLLRNRLHIPVPPREHIVLSTSAGEVFAILEHTGILRGIYGTNRAQSRVKINMMTRTVKYLTRMEMMECRVGDNYPIFPRWFRSDVADEDSLRKVYH